MEKKFPIILVELRKEAGLSQKEAASRLGISQALLSHYEKGIRECGRSFLVKAADFYGTTCDYLLGRSDDRYGSGRGDSIAETFAKAVSIISEKIKKGEKVKDADLEAFWSVEFYRILLFQTQAGNLPKNWAGKAYAEGESRFDPVYLSEIDVCSYRAAAADKNKTPEKDAPVPEPVRLLVEAAERFARRNFPERASSSSSEPSE